jgi:hypothetical protein
MLEHLNQETFKTKVFNFELNKEWKYEGQVPCMIDFYADWCGPCIRLTPKTNVNFPPCLAFRVFHHCCLFRLTVSLRWQWVHCQKRLLKKQLLMY